ncbi:hypothetical protein D9Q98_001525 [Chlorella vulgaris]|uniref:Uncharacterized protein n=1 Tax=Chlorella vulgaris TaxID=3077 RepID=A0A9D4U021_CHLVU|nr:hypothetical protein D9Q98_001525 [Chlorella vulgaris]
MHSLALILLLVLACARVAAHSRDSGPQPPSDPASLALLFTANITSLCEGRCRLTASASPCAAGGGGGERFNSTPTSPAAILEHWNSIALDWQEAAALQVTLHVHCIEAACQPTTVPGAAWRGDDCRLNASAEHPALASQPLPGSHSGSERLFLLNYEQPVVDVAFLPTLDPTAAPGSCQESAPTSADGAELEAPQVRSSLPPHLPADATAATEPRCTAPHLLLLRAALAVWLAACAALATRL